MADSIILSPKLDNLTRKHYNFCMKTMTVGNLKTKFSSVLKDLRRGEEIVIEYGKNHEKLGVIVPYSKYKTVKRKIGILKGASFEMKDDFKMTDEELLSL